VTFTPEADSDFHGASLSLSVEVGGSYADWTARASSPLAKEPFLYSDDRVFTLHPYKDKHYRSESLGRRAKSAGGQRSPPTQPPGMHSARKLPGKMKLLEGDIP
jgi:hypothetical protein